MAKKTKRIRPPVVGDNVTVGQIIKTFLSVHWRGVVTILTPLFWLIVIAPLPAEPYAWVAYTLLIMAVFWMTECIPIAVTGFLPCIIFPLSGVNTSVEVSKAYVNDTIIMFLGSLLLANCIEQSGVHNRLVYFAVRVVGYSHYKLLLAMCSVTTFVSMWITNTAATTMMVPINVVLLRVFEEQKVLQMFDKTEDDELVASDMTCCYFCAATFSATVGGIGTLVGTGTNLVFKGLFVAENPTAPDYISFPLYSAFAVPYMIVLEAFVYLNLVVFYFGAFRPGSKAAQAVAISAAAKDAARKAVEKHSQALGSIKFHEIMAVILFSGTMFLFFGRSPQVFTGWADVIADTYEIKQKKFILDSAVCSLAMFIMMAIPNNLNFFKHFTVEYVEDIPKHSLKSVLDWQAANKDLPYSFMFLLGGGFALSGAAKSSGLNEQLAIAMEAMSVVPFELVMLLVITVVVLVTNFASNVAVANVFVPISMNLAKKLGYHSLWFCVIAGCSASFCFMLPVGTPGNLVAQGAAKIPTTKMIKAGFGPTVTTIIITWFSFYFWAPIIWPVVKTPNVA